MLSLLAAPFTGEAGSKGLANRCFPGPKEKRKNPH